MKGRTGMTVDYFKAWEAEARNIPDATITERVRECRCILCGGHAALDNYCMHCDEEFEEQ